MSGIPPSASPNAVGSHHDLDPASGGRTACWVVISTVACKSLLAIKRVWPRKHPDNPSLPRSRPSEGPGKFCFCRISHTSQDRMYRDTSELHLPVPNGACDPCGARNTLPSLWGMPPSKLCTALILLQLNQKSSA